jgi:hypothetical protein
MGRPTDEQMRAWKADTQASEFKVRNWPVVRRWAALCVVLMLAGLAGHVLAFPRALVLACWAGAAIAGGTMLRWFFDKRYRTNPRR